VQSCASQEVGTSALDLFYIMMLKKYQADQSPVCLVFWDGRCLVFDQQGALGDSDGIPFQI
jgi:hypothetical protein